MPTDNSSNKTKFVIELYDEVTNDDGNVIGTKKVVSEQPIVIEASNKNELDEHALRFKMCGQRMKIVRVILPNAQHQPNMNLSQVQVQTKNVECKSTDDTIDRTPVIPRPDAVPALQVPIQKIQYYTVGGIEIKNDNGKIYQKQWMRLSDKDCENFRIVNSTTNKIVNLSGKSIEMKRWVLVLNDENLNESILNELNENAE